MAGIFIRLGFKRLGAFFQRLFAPKGDDYKALLMADLGIER